MPDRNEAIPDPVLEQAFHWAAVLGDTTVSAADRKAFEHWLLQHGLHQKAWQQIQAVELEFAGARPAAKRGTAALGNVASRRYRKRITAIGSLLSLLLIAGLTHLTIHLQSPEYLTSRGEQQKILLHGARIYLDSNTALDIEDLPDGPLLHLHRGQILVESGSAQPGMKPVVVTKDGRFAPVGTRFLVSKKEHNSDLVVTDGAVSASTDRHTQLVSAGQQWQVTNGTMIPKKTNGLTPDSWVDHVIEADNALLGEVLDLLARQRKGWLHYGDDVAHLRVTGVFRLDDTDAALATLETSLPVHIRRVTPWWISVSKE